MPITPPVVGKRSAPPLPPPVESKRAKKTFACAPWTGAGEGEKVVVYGVSGIGKTSLFALHPRAKFLGLDDGGRRIKHPVTGKDIVHVPGVETFYDVQDALHQKDLWDKGDMCVIDTMTMLEVWAEPFMFDTIKKSDGKSTARNLEDYGYGKGFTHLCDTMRLILQDLDALVRRGVHIGLICQNAAIKRANPSGLDFIEDGPKLSHPSTERASVRLMVCEWADHVLRIGYEGVVVSSPDMTAKVGKATGSATRAIFTQPDVFYFAKTRTIKEPKITFDSNEDDSLWAFMFPEGE